MMKKHLVLVGFVFSCLVALVLLTVQAWAVVDDVVISLPNVPGEVEDGSIKEGKTANLKITVYGDYEDVVDFVVYDRDLFFDDTMGTSSSVPEQQRTIGPDGTVEIDFPLTAKKCRIYGPNNASSGETEAEIQVLAGTEKVGGKPLNKWSNKLSVTCDWELAAAIGSGGGVIDDVIGTLTIPPGALITETTISLETHPIPYPAATPNGKEIYMTRELKPDGLAFQSGHEAILAIPYTKDEDASWLREDSLEAFAFNPSNNQWEPIPFTLDKVNKEIIINTPHFSIYGIGGSPAPVPATSSWALIALGLSGSLILLAKKFRQPI